MNKITDYKIKNHGVTHASLFSPPDKEDYDEVHIGMSYDSHKNALYDAIDSLLFNGYEIPERLERALSLADEEDSVGHIIETNAFESDTEPGLLGYYVSIFVKGESDDRTY